METLRESRLVWWTNQLACLIAKIEDGGTFQLADETLSKKIEGRKSMNTKESLKNNIWPIYHSLETDYMDWENNKQEEVWPKFLQKKCESWLYIISKYLLAS